MKHWIPVLLVFALLLSMMTACKQPNEKPEIHDDSGQSIASQPTELEQQIPETDAPTEPVEPSKPTEPKPVFPPAPEGPAWLPQRPEKMTYEEYFSEVRPYLTDSDNENWLISEGDIYKYYRLYPDINEGLQIILCNAENYGRWGGVVHTVPDTADLGRWQQLGTDGITAYLTQMGNKDCIIAVDLLTGNREYIVKDAVIANAVYCGDVLLYAMYVDGEIQVVRHYIPTGDEQMYATGQKVVGMFRIDSTFTDSGSITWTGLTQEMTEILIKELQNPNSKYRSASGDYDVPSLWEMEDPLNNAAAESLYWHCYDIQKDTGCHTLYKCTIGSDGDILSEATGIVDGCWYADSDDRDHFDPDAEPPAKPTANIGPWVPFVEPMRDVEEETNDVRLVIHNDRSYIGNHADFTLLTDMPIRFHHLLSDEKGYDMDALYASTPDNCLIRVYLDGSTPTVIYEGTDLGYVHVAGQCIMVVDGDQLIQIDLIEQRYRVLFTHENLYSAGGNFQSVYIELVSGLHKKAYDYNIETGEFTETVSH